MRWQEGRVQTNPKKSMPQVHSHNHTGVQHLVALYYRWVCLLDVLFRGPSLGPIPTDGDVGKIAATAADKDKTHRLAYISLV